MATPIPTPNHIIIWLDQYIGLFESNIQLKSGVSEQADPEKILPTSPLDKNINQSIQFKNNMEQSFDKIPKNLKAFSEKDECLHCIGESLDQNKKVFFITSGSMGKDIAPDIIKKYSSLQNIYVFCGYYKAHLEWVEDCLDQNIICIMYDFHTDLLARLLRDVAEYFISEGDKELNQNQQLAYSAISYFNWAKLLLERANTFDTKNIFIRLTYVENRIAFSEQLIKDLNGNVHDRESSEAHQ
jgi:hypothetical protein